MRMRWIAGSALLAVLHTAAEEAAEPELLNVLSYNIQSRPVLDKSAEKNPQIGRRLTAFDLVGVQELFVGDGEFFRNTGGMAHVYFGKKRHAFKLVNSGLAVLAKRPAETSATEYFEDEGSLENRLGSKGILMVRYRIGGEPLDFYTTHLAAGTEEESGESRRNQVRQIIRFIKKHSPDGNAVILCGDFNLRLDKLAAFRELGLRNCAEVMGREKEAVIDHILYRSGSGLKLTPAGWNILNEEFRDKDGRPLSDHQPLQVIFRLGAASLPELDRQTEKRPRS